MKPRPFVDQNSSLFAFAKHLVLAWLTLFGLSAPAQTIRVEPGKTGGKDIQKALDELSAGGEVLLGPGVYVVRRPIILAHDGQKLRGSGAGTILFLEANANCPVVILGAPDRRPRPTSNLRLSDLQIDGNRERQQVELWRMATEGSLINNNGVDIRNVTDVLVDRVTCSRCRSGGLVTSGGVRRLTVRDFAAFDNQFDGLACYETEDSRFTGLSLHDNRAAGISLDLSFNHNRIDHAVLERNDLGIFMRHARDNRFEDLCIRESRNHGVFMAQAATATGTGWKLSPDTECTGNGFANLQISNSAGNAFQVNNASCTNNCIFSGRFTNNRRGGLVEVGAKLVRAEGLGN